MKPTKDIRPQLLHLVKSCVTIHRPASRAFLTYSLNTLLLVFAAACHNDKSTAPSTTITETRLPQPVSTKGVTETKQLLHNGDIVLRTGNDMISSLFSELNKTDQTYSHCGIAFEENKQWFVYHSIGGEENPNEKLRKDPLEKFISSRHNLGYGVCRYSLSTLEQFTLQKTVDSFYRIELPFDMKFDLTSDDRMYCAEMIYKAFNKSLRREKFFTTTVHRGFEYVSTDNLFVNNKAHILCHVDY